jgi:replication restart DNA helicase PriA
VTPHDAKKAFTEHLNKSTLANLVLSWVRKCLPRHDFSNLSMWVLDTDAGLLSLDFRATEHLAQLLIQVSGRAGRSTERGEVVIQTRYPDHPIFSYVLSARYVQFCQ